MIARCIDGKCEGSRFQGEVATLCRAGCGRSLHMLTCAQVGKGYQALGNFTCHHCRLEASMVEGSKPSPAQLENALETAVLELTQGAESTAGSYAEYVRLAEEFAAGDAEMSGRLLLPHHSEESCKQFLTWLARKADRVVSIESVVLGGEAYVTKTSPAGHANVFKSGAVRAHLREIVNKTGVKKEPKTAATPRMVKGLVTVVTAARFDWDFLRARWQLEHVMEGVAGPRLSEVAGAGDLHGLMANHSSIIMAPWCREKWNRQVVELKIEDSKTKNPRYLDVAGLTQISEIPVAAILRRSTGGQRGSPQSLMRRREPK